MALDKKFKTFMIYVTALKFPSKLSKITIFLLQIAQISNNNFVQLVVLQQNKTFIKVLP